MAKTKKATNQAADAFDLSDVKKKADDNGCFMQMFVAYNPDTEVFVFASNDPCAKPNSASSEAALLAAIVVEHLSSLMMDGELPEVEVKDGGSPDDETPKLH